MQLASDGAEVAPDRLQALGALLLLGVVVEKGTKAVISGAVSFYFELGFNQLQQDFEIAARKKEFFDSHTR